MTQRYRSEVRDSTIRELIQKARSQNFGKYLQRIRLNKIRAFQDQVVSFDFPVTALIGTNGGGKSTVLGAAAIAIKQYGQPSFSLKVLSATSPCRIGVSDTTSSKKP